MCPARILPVTGGNGVFGCGREELIRHAPTGGGLFCAPGRHAGKRFGKAGAAFRRTHQKRRLPRLCARVWRGRAGGGRGFPGSWRGRDSFSSRGKGRSPIRLRSFFLTGGRFHQRTAKRRELWEAGRLGRGLSEEGRRPCPLRFSRSAQRLSGIGKRRRLGDVVPFPGKGDSPGGHEEGQKARFPCTVFFGGGELLSVHVERRRARPRCSFFHEGKKQVRPLFLRVVERSLNRREGGAVIARRGRGDNRKGSNDVLVTPLEISGRDD